MSNPFKDFINNLPEHTVAPPPSPWAFSADDVITQETLIERALDYIHNFMLSGASPSTQEIADALMLPPSRVRTALEREMDRTIAKGGQLRIRLLHERGWTLTPFEMMGRMTPHS